MIAVAVDNNLSDLENLCQAIHEVHPNMQIIRFLDPLLAFKYSLSNPVDALYTAIFMNRLDGFKLEKMMKEDHPSLTVNFIADDHTSKAKAIKHMANSYTVKPVTADKLIKAESGEW